jgi:hypothetical protein
MLFHNIQFNGFIGSYGLTSLDPSDPVKTIVGSIQPTFVTRNLVGEQCLRFYYYFTVYEQLDMGQQIQVWIRQNNQPNDQISIGNLTFADMKVNKWNFQNMTYISTFADYSVRHV